MNITPNLRYPKKVILFDNQMLMVFDDNGKQIPQLQGVKTDFLMKKIKRLSNEDTVFEGFNKTINWKENIINCLNTQHGTHKT